MIKHKEERNIQEMFSSKDKANLIKQIRELVRKLDYLNFSVKLLKKDNLDKKYNIYKQPYLSFLDLLDPKKFPWYLIEIPPFTTFQIYQAFREVIPNEYVYKSTILKMNHKDIIQPIRLQEELVSIIKTKDNQTNVVKFQEDNQLYCYCQRVFKENEYMIGILINLI